jgi:hypothetical protein
MNYAALPVWSVPSLDDGAPMLRVHLIYEDTETGLRAKQAVDRLGEQFNLETGACLTPWRFDRLWEPTSREQALLEATDADLLLVSAHGEDGLPPAAQAWLERWLQLPHTGPRGLVLSLDTQARGTAGADYVLALLQDLARPAGVDVFPHFGPTLWPDWEAACDQIRTRAEFHALWMEGPQIEDQSYLRWGINE